MIQKVFVANRGEIAVRIIRACRELGIKTAIICPTIEAGSLPSQLADEVVSSEDRRVYLDIPALIAAAKECGADAVHPGYGFLSENADFALACAEAGLAFIGPDAEAIRIMGEKTLARRTMIEHNVPVTPGSDTLSGLEEALAAAEKIGYPVMLKASAGGGGRGIRVAKNAEELTEMFPQAQKEAKLAFANDDMYLEKYLIRPRHVEIQILADSFGNTVYIGERECSLQRRRQKVLEEAPSVAVTPALRAKMGDVAVRAAKAVNYCGAGTVEFLLDGENFYFMEMNTRIQVEHPVSEMTTGIDLLKEQLRIAAGEPLSVRQEEIRISGWAMECRINAEDPARNFRPTPGKVSEFEPPLGPWTRFDTYLRNGGAVSPFYDSMVGKLVVWGRDREEAVARMKRALGELKIEGIMTNKSMFLKLLEDPAFNEGDIYVTYLEKWLENQ